MDILLVVSQEQEDVHVLVQLQTRSMIKQLWKLLQNKRRHEAVDLVLKHGDFKNYVPRDRVGSVEADLILKGPVTN